MSILNYEKFMSKNGFGFNLSRQIDIKYQVIFIYQRETQDFIIPKIILMLIG